ncbi:MAG: Mur ligase family protein [Chitinophagales bacterium]|nr:Mur ligase family protein [Chitinophagales bacterium]MDW8428294.1 Mur ligase family protein [Chitinophagales bacterium]
MNVHFIAIGGSVMHSLAIALHKAGHTVTGSDDVLYDPARSRLQRYGLLPKQEGWHPERIHRGLDAVIVGMHARPDNPELQQALQMELRVYSYPSFLVEHARHKRRVVIAGSHGKTTITAMVLHVFRWAKLKCDYLLGATTAELDESVQLSTDAPWMIFEGDEYPDAAFSRKPKFLVYEPHAALISGLAWDHINFFPTEQEYHQAFDALLNGMANESHVIYCVEDATLDRLVKKHQHRLKTVPYATPHYHIDMNGWTLFFNGKNYTMQLIGKHNMQNTMGAATLCHHVAGIPLSDALQALTTFSGAHRRLQLLAINDHCMVYNDFAHAPSKVRASVQAVRETHPDRVLVACLELHTFSSLNERFIDLYQHALAQADVPIVLLDRSTVLRKGQTPFEPDRLRRAFADHRLRVAYDAESLVALLQSIRWQSHVLLLMSSGSWGGLGAETLAGLVTAGHRQT